MKVKNLVNLMAASSLVLSTSVYSAGMTFGNNNQAAEQETEEQNSHSQGNAGGAIINGVVSGAKDLQDGLKRGLAGFLKATGTTPAAKADPNTTGLNGTILKDIFLNEPYESYEKTPYPRVAFTIHTYPSVKVGDPMGCWNISAVLWRSSTERVDVPKFDWCYHENMAYDVAFYDLAIWMNQPVFDPEEHTGARRTIGPIPPQKAAPTHPRYRSIYQDANLSVQTTHGYMFGSLLYQMGFDWGIRPDRRVWVVDFETYVPPGA